jgi:hypothetical protein
LIADGGRPGDELIADAIELMRSDRIARVAPTARSASSPARGGGTERAGGRATLEYRDEVQAGETQVRARRIGDHSIFADG